MGCTGRWYEPGQFDLLLLGIKSYLAGGGAYYFAKRSVNADRKARHEADMKRRRLSDSLESSSRQSNHKGNHHRAADNAGNPSSETSQHGPENEGPKAQVKSKYEASEPYRHRKGDRFS